LKDLPYRSTLSWTTRIWNTLRRPRYLPIAKSGGLRSSAILIWSSGSDWASSVVNQTH
jgi:hypothetical protein